MRFLAVSIYFFKLFSLVCVDILLALHCRIAWCLTSLGVDGTDGLDEQRCVGLGILHKHQQELQRRLHHQTKLRRTNTGILIITHIIFLIYNHNSTLPSSPRAGRATGWSQCDLWPRSCHPHTAWSDPGLERDRVLLKFLKRNVSQKGALFFLTHRTHQTVMIKIQ